MDFNLPEDAEQLRRAVLQFAANELRDDLIQRDAASTFWREGWRKCGAFGLAGLPAPIQYGGGGHTLVATIAAMEALGYACPDLGLNFSLNAHLYTNVLPIAQFGTEQQKQRWLPALCRGEWIGASAASEPEAGSDSGSMTTRAERQGDQYVLNGVKTFVTNAQVADVFMTFAITNPRAGQLGISAFIVPRHTPGLSIRRDIDKMGLRTSPMGEVEYQDCKVQLDSLLGREGSGAAIFNVAMEYERGCILAMYLGNMQRQLEKCIAHACRRIQFGQPIGRFQSVANRIVDMKVRLEAARPLIYKIGWLKDNHKPALMEAAIAKVFLSEAAVASSLDGIQVFGGWGYTTEQEIERDLRDAVSSKLYSGTVDIQRNIIARFLGLPPSTIRPQEHPPSP